MTVEDRVRVSFQRQTVMQTLGMILVEVKEGECIIGFDYAEKLTQLVDYLKQITAKAGQ